MLNLVKKFTAIIFMAGAALPVSAQKKELTDDQYFKSNFKGIIQPLPIATNWTDNTHFTLLKDGKKHIVDCVTGNLAEVPVDEIKTMEVTKPVAYSKNNDLFININGAEIQLTSDSAKEVNPTMSPDGNYVAYTKKNDLYTIAINTKNENRLTT